MSWIERGETMSLDKPILFNIEETSEVETSKTYALDWENKRIIGFVDEALAVKQYISKALTTPRFKCLIYDSQYGSEIKDVVITKNVTRSYIEAELPFLIRDALIHDERILKVNNIEFEFDTAKLAKDSILVTFEVDTVYGAISMQETI